MAIAGQYGHFALMVVNAGAALADSAVTITQWCLPFLRQHSGSTDSAEGSNSGNTTSQVIRAHRMKAMLRCTEPTVYPTLDRRIRKSWTPGHPELCEAPEQSPHLPLTQSELFPRLSLCDLFSNSLFSASYFAPTRIMNSIYSLPRLFIINPSPIV
jgi:hypothetical protein